MKVGALVLRAKVHALKQVLPFVLANQDGKELLVMLRLEVVELMEWK